MKDVIKKYENVFVPLSESEVELRVKNAKEKAIKFYAGIFGVQLSEVEKYNERFTTNQYLFWGAKEVINKGTYSFAANEPELIEGGTMGSSTDLSPEDFAFGSAVKYPAVDKVPEVLHINCYYNNPHFETYIVHETGHVLDYTYRILKNIRSKTASRTNASLCYEAVSVFFETLYAKTHDPMFIQECLTDWYGIIFFAKVFSTY